MALDTDLKATGVKNILRKLRSTSPKPPSPEDDLEGMMTKATAGGMGPGPGIGKQIAANPEAGAGPEDEEDESIGSSKSPGIPAAPQAVRPFGPGARAGR